MQRYFVNELNSIISGQDAHHIKKVMRMKNDDQIIVCAKSSCILASIEINDTDVSYKKIKELSTYNHFDVTILQGLPKGNKIDFVTKYATVYGASNIYFSGMERSIVKLGNEGFKKDRLTAIAKEAAELAHRSNVPNIEMYKSIKDIDFDQFDDIIVCDEDEHMIHISSLLPLNYESKYLIIIGPEGGISDKERAFYKSKNAKFISLGHLIIPTEAAVLSALSFFMHQNVK